MAKLVPKTLEQQLSALEDHLYLLAKTLSDLAGGEAAHIRQLAAQLRALVCTSSGMPGLLWRMRDEIGAVDDVHIRYPGNIDTKRPITRGMLFAGALLQADGSGPAVVPQMTFSLRRHISEHEAVFVDGTSITHEHLISRLANETGVAHEAHGVSKEIAKLNAVLVGDVQMYFHILDTDARLVLQVGDRIIGAATRRGYIRRRVLSLVESAPSLQSTRFTSPLEVPSVSPDMSEGTIAVILELKKFTSEKPPNFPIRFPPFSQGRVTIWAEISKQGRIYIRSEGLPLRFFGVDFAPPESGADSIVIAITWEGLKTKVFAAGRQVAGPVEAT